LNRKSVSKIKWIYSVFIIMLSLLLFSLTAFAATYTYDSLNRLTNVDYGGGKGITYTYDAGGNILSVTAQGFDEIPPETQIALEGTAGKDGWYRTDVKVTLTATDNEGGSGVKVTRYSFDGTTWTDYTVPFTVSAEGTTTVRYRSTDREDNVEVVKEQAIKIDKTAPVITGAALTQPNAAGWYNTDVTVRFNASDALSGVDTVSPDTVISTEGANQSVSGTAADMAGNIAVFTLAGINIDKTAPVTTGTPDRQPNANGWYNADVQVTLSAADGLSGVSGTEYSLDGTNWRPYTSAIIITTEGTNEIYCRSADVAGNIESAGSITIRIDKTPPAITGAPTVPPNANGWHNADVNVRFTATDETSGVDSVTADTVLAEEGTGYSVSGSAVDKAGNTASFTVSGINIDKTPPVITGAALTQPNIEGWYNTDVKVHYEASDELSGIDTITPDTLLSTEGAGQTATGTAVDKAGNSADFSVTGINIDKTSPVTTVTPDRQPNKNSWYNAGVQVSLSASDSLSGVAGTEYSLDGSSWSAYTTAVTVSDEGITDIYYRSTDVADNTEKANKLTIRIDKTPPIITGSPTRPPNEYGWYNTDVTVRFTATDALSGIEDITPDRKITGEGAGQSVTGTAVDKAGNSAEYTVENINIDKTNPEIYIRVPEDGAEYLLNASVPGDWSAVDSLSGIATATGDSPSGDSFDTASVGEKQFTVEAVDRAGNRETKTVTYYVRYNFIGLLEPIAGEDKTFKGNTVPVKFRLTDASGSTAPDATARLYLTSAGGGGETEAVSTSNAVEGNLFRYDSGDEQYIFNLNTGDLEAGTWQLRVSLDDGTSQYANIEIEDKEGLPAEKPADKKGQDSQGKEKQNGNSVDEPENPLTEPVDPVVEPVDPVVEPDEPVVEPDEPVVEPDEPVVEPDNPTAVPDNPGTEPVNPAVEPDNPGTEPDASGQNVVDAVVDLVN